MREWAIEGAGHYGSGLTRYLGRHGERLLEVSRTRRGERRLRGKNDPLDAVRAARAALASERPPPGRQREALRVLLLARRSAVDVRRVALVQLRSVIVTAPESLRQELRQLPIGELIRRCSRLRRSDSRTPDELAAIALVLRSLARRILAATREADRARARDPRSRPRARTAAARRARRRPDRRRPTDRRLVTPRPRSRSEAAFARLAGAAPIPASSGQTTRQRLSRGGDRQLNRALHTVILQRRLHDAATKDYIARRVAEGKTSRDAVRLLKRYLARHLYPAVPGPQAQPRSPLDRHRKLQSPNAGAGHGAVVRRPLLTVGLRPS